MQRTQTTKNEDISCFLLNSIRYASLFLVLLNVKILIKISGKNISRLCLVPGKYKGKKKNAKENDFLMFDCPMKNIKENKI